jgi:hypothetical protein
MPHVYEDAAGRILEWFVKAEDDLLGHTVITFSGEAGTVQDVKLDEHHGLCFTIEMPTIHEGGLVLPDVAGSRRYFPVATIKFHGPRDPHYAGPDHH